MNASSFFIVIIKCLQFCAFMILASIVLAEEQRLLSLKLIFTQSLQYYPLEKNAAIDEHIAQNDIELARGTWYPRVDLAVDEVESDNDDNDYREGRISIRQTVYNQSALYTIDEAEASLNVAKWQNTEQRQLLLIEIAEIYTQALIQTQQEQLAKQSLAESEILHKVTKKAVELDQKPLLDLLRAQADLEEKRAELIEAQNAKEDIRNQLLQYIPEVNTLIELQPFNFQDYASKTNVQGLNHPSLYRLSNEEAQLQSALEVERSAYYPSVDLVWDLSQRRSHSSLEAKDVTVQESRVTLSLNWNLFQGFATSHSEDSARQKIVRKINERALAELNLAKQISQVESSIMSDQQSLQALEKVLLFRQQSVTTAEKSWELNLINITDVQTEYSALQQTKLDIYTLQRTLGMEQLRLLFLTGKLNIK